MDVNDVMHRKRARRMLGILKKSVSWVRVSGEDGWLSELSGALCRVRTCWGADGKVSTERWYLSPYVEKPLNSNLIKCFVPVLRSRYMFLCFVIPVLCIYVINILCTFHIFISGYVTSIHLTDFRFRLVSFFNGISNLCRLFNAKAILLEER